MSDDSSEKYKFSDGKHIKIIFNIVKKKLRNYINLEIFKRLRILVTLEIFDK